MEQKYVQTSKKLSYLLRHCRNPLYIDLNGGWASVDTILQVLHISKKDLDEIVETDAKTRYSYDETGKKIRANQGHSIPGCVVSMEHPDPPDVLYHGTATRFLDSIMKNGLKPMSRQWVHISPDYETAIKVGQRHGKPVVLLVHAKQFAEDGNELFLSSNAVWQAKDVPAIYLEVI